MKKILIILFIFILMLSITACSKTIKTEDGELSFKDGKIDIKTDEGSASVKDGKLVLEDEDGKEVFEASKDGVDLPKGYPSKLIPIIDGSIVITASKGASAEDGVFLVTAMTKKEVKDVIDFYKDIMADAENNSTVLSKDMNMISGLKDNMHIAIIITQIDEDDYKTSISISTKRED